MKKNSENRNLIHQKKFFFCSKTIEQKIGKQVFPSDRRDQFFIVGIGHTPMSSIFCVRGGGGVGGATAMAGVLPVGRKPLDGRFQGAGPTAHERLLRPSAGGPTQWDHPIINTVNRPFNPHNAIL